MNAYLFINAKILAYWPINEFPSEYLTCIHKFLDNCWSRVAAEELFAVFVLFYFPCLCTARRRDSKLG